MSTKMSLDQPGVYRITVQGRLDARWADFFDDLQFIDGSLPDGSAITTLAGSLPDQAAVQGVLQKLYNLGFPILALQKVD